MSNSKLISRRRRPKISIVSPSKILEPDEDEDLNFEVDDLISKVTSSTNPSIEVNRKIFSVNTRNMCLLCFQTCSGNKTCDVDQISKLFKVMMRFLNINIWQLCGLSKDVALSQRNVDLFVTLCSTCESVSQQVFELYPQFEKIVMQLDECCRLLQNSMESGRKTENQTKSYRSSIQSSNIALVLQEKVAEKIRNETRSKCSQRLQKSFPRLRITKEIHLSAVSSQFNRFTPASNFDTCYYNMSVADSLDDYQSDAMGGNEPYDGEDCIEVLAVKKLSESAKPIAACSEIRYSSNFSPLPPSPVAIAKACPLSKKKKKLVAINELQAKSSGVKILFSCYICKAKLSSKDAFKVHFETHHSKNKAPIQTASAESLATKTKPTSKSVLQVSQGSSKSAPNVRNFDTCKNKAPAQTISDGLAVKANSNIVPQVLPPPPTPLNLKKCKICADDVIVDLRPHMIMVHGTSHFSRIIAPKWSDADVTNIVNDFIDSCTVIYTTPTGFLFNCTSCTRQYKSKHLFDLHILKLHYSLLTDAVQTEAKKEIKGMHAAVQDTITKVNSNIMQERQRMKGCKLVPPPNPHPRLSMAPTVAKPVYRNTCVECTKDFGTIEELSKHRRMEHNFMTIKCDMCDNEYMDRLAINFHRRTKHNVDIEAEKIMLAEKEKRMRYEEKVVKLTAEQRAKIKMRKEEKRKARRERLTKINKERAMKTKQVKLIKAAKEKVIQAAKDKKIRAAKEKENKAAMEKVVKAAMDKELETPKEKVVIIEKEKVKKKKKIGYKMPKACPICSKILCSQKSLEHHLATHHSGKKEYCCEQCGAQFAIYASLKRHLFSHSGVKNQNLACNFCSKRFAWSSSLKIHLRLHTNERPYQCDQCGKAFNQKCSLIAHAKQHE